MAYKKSYSKSSSTEPKKNRFQVSQEIKEEFVNRIAEMMVSVGEKGHKWRAGWKQGTAGICGFPFCAATGRKYSGVNAVMLHLTSMLMGYDDARWMTFNQVNDMRKKDPDNLKNMHVRKGEKGVTILRPEPAYYVTDPETSKWRFLSAADVAQIRENNDMLEAQGKANEKTKLESIILYYPFTVFNATQIEGFPKSEAELTPPADIERNEFVENFIASSGVEVRHKGNQPRFRHNENVVEIPVPTDFESTEEYYAAKLHEFFHATGHASREDRQKKETQTREEYAFEEMRAEIFSVLAGAQLNLPVTIENSAAYIASWNRKFSGGEAKEVFNAARDASKILTLMDQYGNSEQPGAEWFPSMKDWPKLINEQKERDKIDNAVFTVAVKEDSETRCEIKTEADDELESDDDELELRP